MCGIAGLIDPTLRGDPEGLDQLATSMGDRLAHRGPDDAGTWVDDRWGVGLSHRRLSIFDLSPLGHQPMVVGRRPVRAGPQRRDLQPPRRCAPSSRRRGHRFRGHSDTEVLLAAFERVGARRRAPPGERDVRPRRCGTPRPATLHLARDRLGEKPLYYGMDRRHVPVRRPS